MNIQEETSLRVLVLEDEWVARNFLVELIEASGLGNAVGAVATLDDAEDLLSNTGTIDAVFVDINLAGSEETGLTLVRKWVDQPTAPMFVLATALKEHALEAFALGVVDYLTKPFTKERVRRCLERLQKKSPARSSGRPRRIVARRKRNLVFLAVDDVWAFEAADRLTLVHSRHGTFDIDLSLTTIEGSLGRQFLRVHRAWLVNEAHVRELDRESGESALLVGGAYANEGEGIRVPVARDRSQIVRDRLLAATAGIRER